MARPLKNKFGDTSGRIPQPTGARDALRHIQKLARDKKKHVMLSDYCDLLELKLRIVSVLATRGLRASDSATEQPPA